MATEKRKKILIFIDWFLPGYKAGGPIRSCSNIVDHLHTKFDFHIVTRDTDYQETKPYSGIKPNVWLDFQGKAKVYYISSDKLGFGIIRKFINENQWDGIYLNHIFSTYFSIAPILFKKNIKLVLAPRGAFASGALGVKSAKKKYFIKFVKALGVYKNVVFHATNEKEKQEIIDHLGSNIKVKVASNLPRLIQNEKSITLEKEVGDLRLVSVARVSPEKNTLFALEVLKGTNYNGNIQFDIYGAINNQDYWSKCKSIIEKLPENIQVNYLDSIDSDHVIKTMMKYHFLFMPTLGENYGHSILESFTANRPVIISDQTPWRNLKIEKVGWDLPLNISDFEQVITQALSMDNTDYQKLCNSCGVYVKKIFENNQLIADSEALFKDL
ncbi:MAG: glycosyltransferase [Flavobacteriales bacterium]|nr:glycosyltransferase [Flavobacteriales bacterium]